MKKPSKIVIKIVKKVSLKDMVSLYKDAGWWDPLNDNTDKLKGIIKGSAFFAAAFRKKEMVGMGRVLSDFVSDAYIQDLVVKKKFRGKGIGKRILLKLVKELKKRNINWIGVIAEPKTSKFYKKLGFKKLKNHLPLKYNMFEDKQY